MKTARSIVLQWGRDVSIPEMAFPPPRTSATTVLQWGRDVSIPEIAEARLYRITAPCFNGAGMFLSRKYSTLRLRRGWTVSLQWGRDVSIPEISSTARALRQAWRFNGAGMFLSRKFDFDGRFLAFEFASMGPGCFYPGNIHDRTGPRSLP